MFRTARRAWHGVVDELNSLRSEWVEYERPIMVEPLEPRTLLAGHAWDVVLIDRTLPRSDMLVRAVLGGARVITYDGRRESADAVLDRVVSLADSSGWQIGSLSILAHGRPGQFMLGNQWISSENLTQDAGAWEKLSAVLAPHGTIRLYGCNVAGGFSGTAILNRLATLTGAEVFASTDITGRGGDWALESASPNATADLPEANSAPFNTRILVRYPGQLSGTLAVNTSNASTDLSGAGTIDWIHFGNAGVQGIDRKASGGNLLSAYTVIGSGAVVSYSDDTRALSWTGGSPTATSAETPGTGSGVYISGVGNGFSLSAPADQTTRTLTVYVGGLNSSGTFRAHLSDSSTADFVDTTPAVPGQYDRTYTISYSANSPGQTLTVTWIMASGGGNVALSAAALGLAPTISTPASSNSATIAGTSASLSVLGADDGTEPNLTYTWSVLSKPTGAADPSYSSNGTNASKDTTATFSKAGSYTLQVTVTDKGGLTATSTVGVTVRQTFSQIAVTNVLPALAENTTHTFTAVAEDQFGDPMPTQPAFAWSVDGGGPGGTIDPLSGLYAAPSGGSGADTVRATSGGISGTAAVVVTTDGIFSGGADIGYPGQPGTFAYDPATGAYALEGGGYDIWNNWDAFYFASRTISGDVTIVARVNSVGWSDWWSKAGVMIRANGAGDSPFVMVTVNPSNGVEFQWRTTAGGYADWTGNRVDDWGPPKWIKLTRSGDTFSGYFSTDGTTWTQLGSVNVSMPAASSAGLMVTAHNDTVLNPATFDNVSIIDPVRVAVPAASAENHFTQPTTNLSVVGASDAGESTLLYNWTVVSKPAGAPDPTFSLNGTNAAKNTAVTFYASGDYTFRALITDGAHSTSSDVNVTVAATYQSMTLTPATATLVPIANSFQFRLTMIDQFNQPVAVLPTLNWSCTGPNNSISNTGLFIAGITPGVFNVSVSGFGFTQSATITVQPALQAWWTFDENAGTTAGDSSGSGLGGILVNGPAWAPGQSGSGLSFDPLQGQYVAVPDSPGLNPTGGITVAAWIDATDWNGNRRIVQKDAADNQYRLLAEGGELKFDIAGVGFVTAPLPSAGAWHHVAGTYNGSLLALYVDGVQVASLAAQGPISTSIDPLVIGAKNTGATIPGDCFSGTIDDVRIYARGMTPAEVAALFGNNAAPPTIVNPASASPPVVVGNTTDLSVLGDTAAGEGTLIYAWAATSAPAGAAQPVFSFNSTNAAKATTVTFSKAGTYTLTCTILDASGNFVLSSVSVTVQQVFTGIAIHPGSRNIPAGVAYPLIAVAVDQFGDPMASQSGVAWAVRPGGAGGTVDAAGVYTSPASGGTDVITAVFGTFTATATLTSVPTANVNYSSGFGSGGMTFNGGAGVTGGALVITDDNWGEARSAFVNVPVDVRTFETAFAFQIPDAGADGFTFTLQTNSPTALGGAGGALGYAGIPHSIAIKFDIWDNTGEGSDSTGLYVNGVMPTRPAVDLAPSGIDLHSGHAFNVVMTYDGSTLTVQISDTATGVSATQTYAIDIPGVLGSDIAYAGFTGGTGGLFATQRVLHWEYINRISPDPPGIAIAPTATADTPTTAVLSVLGSDAAGENTLTYTWWVVGQPDGAAQPVFSDNATNSAKNASIRFFAAGTYTLLVNVSDGTLGVVGSLQVTVQQVLTGLTILPGTTVLLAGQTHAFTVDGLDQFGAAMAAPGGVSWSIDAGITGATIDGTGLVNVPAGTYGQIIIHAAAGTVAASVRPLVTGRGIFSATADIGSPGQAGSLTFDPTNGMYQVWGGGGDIWNNSDQFYFASTPVQGDLAIVARVMGVTQTDDWAKAGVMLRASSDADAMFVDLVITPFAVSLQWRNATGGPCDCVTTWGVGHPQWVKLARNGTEFTGWFSDDGVSWTAVGSVIVPLPAATLAGLAVTAHNNALLNAALFQDVALGRAPVIVTPAAASDLLISGTGTNLWVTGSDSLSEAGLVYTWSVVSTPIGSPDPVFASGAANQAGGASVRLFHAGVYVFRATVINSFGLTASSLVSVRALQTFSRIELTPPIASVQSGESQQFAARALDQFGNPLVAQPRFTWAVDSGGAGSVSPAGLFTAIGRGPAMVRAQAAELTAVAPVTVWILSAPPAAQGAGAPDVRPPHPPETFLIGSAPPVPTQTDGSQMQEVRPADSESPRLIGSGAPAASTALTKDWSGEAIQARLAQALDRSPFGSGGAIALESALQRDLIQYSRLKADATAARLGSDALRDAMLDASRAQIASEFAAYSALAGSPIFRHAIDTLLQQGAAAGQSASMVTKVAATTTVAFSAGYLLWCLQGGTFFMSMLTAVPFWTWFDPLPVLDSWDQLRGGLSARGGNKRVGGSDDDADMNWLMGELPAA